MTSDSGTGRDRHLRPSRPGRRAQALIELALTLPLLLVVFIAVVELSRLTATYSLLVEVAGDAARYWSRIDNQAQSTTQIETKIREALKGNYLDPSSVTIALTTGTDPDDGSISTRRVSLGYTAQPIAPVELFGYRIFDPGFTVYAVSVYRDESGL